MKRWWYLIFIALLITFLFFARKGKYNEFHRAEINGPIDTIYRYRDYVMIYIKNVEFRIIPVALDAAPALDDIARKGDRLSKKANSDTLHLIHDGDEGFFYTVRKY